MPRPYFNSYKDFDKTSQQLLRRACELIVTFERLKNKRSDQATTVLDAYLKTQNKLNEQLQKNYKQECTCRDSFYCELEELHAYVGHYLNSSTSLARAFDVEDLNLTISDVVDEVYLDVERWR